MSGMIRTTIHAPVVNLVATDRWRKKYGGLQVRATERLRPNCRGPFPHLRLVAIGARALDTAWVSDITYIPTGLVRRRLYIRFGVH